MQSKHHVEPTWIAVAALWRNSSSGSVGSNSGSSPSSNVSPSSRASASSTYFTPITDRVTRIDILQLQPCQLCPWSSAHSLRAAVVHRLQNPAYRLCSVHRMPAAVWLGPGSQLAATDDTAALAAHTW